MPTISNTPAATWKATIRKPGWPTVIKTFRTKRDAQDWARRTEDEMVRGVYVERASSERMLPKRALDRYMAEVVPTKRPSTQRREQPIAVTLKAALAITVSLRSRLTSLQGTVINAWRRDEPSNRAAFREKAARERRACGLGLE